MKSRSLARQLAFQALFPAFLVGADLEETLAYLCGEERDLARGREYATTLAQGTLRDREDLDAWIAKHLVNWELGRLGAGERTLLRLAAFELRSVPDVPPSVVIDEALNLARLFAMEDACAFLNGVLDSMAREIRATEMAARG